MNIENMTAFIRVAELKSISAAAKELHHLQSNMTNKIKNIEKEFDTQLFHRYSHGVKLTTKGELVYHQFKKIILLWKETIAKVETTQQTILLGVMQSSLPFQLNDIINKFHHTFPNMRISIVTDSTDNLIRKVETGELAFAFITDSKDSLQLSESSPIIGEILTFESLVIIGDKNNKPIRELLNTENFFVSSKECSSYKALMKMKKVFKLESLKVSEINIVETLINLSTSGLGLGIIPTSLAEKYKVSTYCNLPKEFADLQKIVIYHKDHKMSGSEKWLIEKSKNELQK
ncbi:LysR family transcriptional regulator [Enterococcus durans]|uniref:LysR family transcriptional regulator n=1 Tax=Enterococcus durans TaxID=53345 RepID=UPI00115E1D9C|nr:LysR family transcriptional regulator [Enterococcus durans]EGO2513517.1 LysR family transcriptional regulator [Enterococcus faecalis]